MKILRVKKLPLWDVFIGEGWLNWTRVVKQGETLKVIGGNQLSATEKFAVAQFVKEIKDA